MPPASPSLWFCRSVEQAGYEGCVCSCCPGGSDGKGVSWREAPGWRFVGTSALRTVRAARPRAALMAHLCFALSPAVVQDTGSLHAQSHHHLRGPAQCQSRPGTPPPHPLGRPSSRAAGLAPHLPGRLGSLAKGEPWAVRLRETHRRPGFGSRSGVFAPGEGAQKWC